MPWGVLGLVSVVIAVGASFNQWRRRKRVRALAHMEPNSARPSRRSGRRGS